MVDHQYEDGHTTLESEPEPQQEDHALVVLPPQKINTLHGEGTSRNPFQRWIQSEIHYPENEEPPQITEILGIVHKQREQLEQLKQEAERQRKVEQELRKEIGRKALYEEKIHSWKRSCRLKFLGISKLSTWISTVERPT
ncbi:hypothetical protein AHAS_Ahas04G0137500 [Arachis hypogaea]